MSIPFRAGLVFVLLPSSNQAFASGAQNEPLDVCDVSILWPPPTTPEQRDRLIAADLTLADPSQSLLSEARLAPVLAHAAALRVKNSAGGEHKIRVNDDFKNRSNWKVAGIRIDPSAPGTEPMFVGERGSTPQIRFVLQPVTVAGEQVKVHDFAIHLAFNFNAVLPPPGEEGSPAAKPTADKEAFLKIANDLRDIKSFLKAKGVTTSGPLHVHPGLKANTEGLAERLTAFVKRHITEARLTAIAFMGVETPEPWIFFAMVKRPDGTFFAVPLSSAGGNRAQMLSFRGGKHVFPVPTNINIDPMRGVSTATLFERNADMKLDDRVFDDLARPVLRDIPDFVANPRRSMFFNTDCISCHTESTRRIALRITPTDETFTFKKPDGVSGVADEVVPKDTWNVRNFGWFSRTGPSLPSVTMRTANEAAESAHFINREYPTRP